jgi:flagellar hook-length control protein FliK
LASICALGNALAIQAAAMEHCPSLRSLEAVAGRPSGTGRPTSSSDREPEQNFEQALTDRAERQTEARERRVERQDQRVDRAHERRSTHRTERPREDERPDRAAGQDAPRDEAVQSERADASQADETQASSPNEAHRDAATAKSPNGGRLSNTAAKVSAVSPTPEAGPTETQSTDVRAESAAAPVVTSLPMVRTQTAAHAETQPIPLDLPVAATGESSEVVPSTLRPDSTASKTTASPDEARGRSTAEPATPDATAQPTQRFEVDTRTQAERANEPARSAHTPTPAEQHAADILKQLKLELAIGRREAQLQLEPAQLGRISVKLALARGRVSAEVRAESSDTLAVLQRHVPELRAMLEARGVTPESFDFQLGFQDERQNGAQYGGTRREAGAGTAETAGKSTNSPAETRSLVRAAWGIDTYA